ncbi:AzlD domain-containing protein [Brevibacterium sp. 5221]|uniref:AzlD domain-containing protein n=1 Tax=Brevibacterium rongguiense TaxID=2695267 RepID=A0A6N9H7H8_9MICO|nr:MULTISPECIES: AzlD domain-containing protein [Brevibacterium]MYM19502.1 AzlD domain-containing protein [Brevibacterium rongguiense]WAL39993.1 AzlD domain-containing protein [Brevibacterium sp. BRM-1]
MSPVVFLLSLAGLAGGTYLIRRLGVRVGAQASSPDDAAAPAPARVWIDRATVVLIVAVAMSNMFFEGHELVGPARPIGVGVGIVAAVCRVPMLVCVVIAMGACALLRLLGLP